MAKVARQASREGSALNLKDGTEVVKNAFDILKSLLLITVLAVLVFNWQWVNNMLDRMNASKIVLGAITIERDTAADSIRAAADALPKNREALAAAKRDLLRLQKNYADTAAALRASQAALRELQARGASPGPPPPSVAEARRLSSQALAKVEPTLASAQRTTVGVDRAARSTGGAISALPEAGNTSAGFGIVFGGDRTLEDAENQLRLGERARIGKPHIFRRQGMYRSVAVFQARADANAALPAVKALNRWAADAYVVNLASWCPGVEVRGRIIDCGL